MTFGSLFAGIGGFDLALTRAGLRSLYAAEINPHCNSVRRRHWPDERQITDVAAVDGDARPDVVCAGWPCQGNSVAGKRAGLADARSGLWGEVVRVLAAQSPRWFLGENVPGILSVNGGRDFGAVLGSLAKLGYGFAYRVLDAQHFGLAQRRKRVFVVGCLGDWRAAAEILFEREGVPWDSPARRDKGQGVASSITASAGHHGYSGPRGDGSDNLVPTLARRDTTREGQRLGDAQDTLIPFTIPERSSSTSRTAGPGGRGYQEGIAFTLESRHTPQSVATSSVRRLTPRECERLQGFPDDWTATAADGTAISDSARYRMLGNAVAVPCVEWIARRIAASGAKVE